MFSFTYGALTDKGDLRRENQDHILHVSGTIEGRDAALFVIADGMGGLAYGSQVSEYVVRQFERWWKEDLIHIVRDQMDQENDIREILEQEIWDMNRAVLQFNRAHQCRSGSTLSLLFFYHGRYYIENIGDSRVYRIRDGGLEQMTEDQSVIVGEKHMLTMCIGMFDVLKSFYVSGEIRAGDCYCLCSDGLYNRLSAEKIEKLLTCKALQAQEKVVCLRQTIEPGQASDNVSVIVAEVIDQLRKRK